MFQIFSMYILLSFYEGDTMKVIQNRQLSVAGKSFECRTAFTLDYCLLYWK